MSKHADVTVPKREWTLLTNPADGAITGVRLQNLGSVPVRIQAAATAPEWVAGPLGVGQTWQDLTASRSSGVSYQNLTGRPIQVIVSQENSAGNNAVDLEVSTNGTTWVMICQSMSNSGGRGVVSAVIPNNIYYRATLTIALLRWAELR